MKLERIKRVAAGFTLSLVTTSPAASQTIHDSTSPTVGVETTSAVGETVYEKSHYTSMPAYEALRPFQGKNIFAYVVINAGDVFMPVKSSSALKACRSPSIDMFRQGLYNACLYDDDLNGVFDRFGGNEVQGGKKILPNGIPYKNAEFVEPTPDALKQVVIFLGSTRDSVRLSYREFVNDMARPAFTEEYTFPISGAYPQVIAFKGVRMTLSGIDGEGMHYRIDKRG